MENKTEQKNIVGAKVKLNNIFISYQELSELLKKQEYNTTYLDEAISKEKVIHSIYFKPDEIQYLFDGVLAESHYDSAGYSCIDFYEMELSELLKQLNYPVVEDFNSNVEDDFPKHCRELPEFKYSPKKSKFLTFEYNKILFSYKKKLINSIRYFPDGDLFIDTIEFKEKPTVFKKVDKSTYDIIMSQL